MKTVTLGIMGAMREEVQLLLQELEAVQEIQLAGMTFYRGLLHGVSVVVCQSGVGKVNAAMCAQVLISQFGVEQLVFTGVAGALHPTLQIGDMVISTDCQYHDMDASPLGFAVGEIPFAVTSVFPADQVLIDLVSQISNHLYPGKVHRGRVLSGDQFIADREKVKWMNQTLGGWCTEMEGAAVAHVCHANGVRFVIIRSMSDRADGSAHENFTAFVQEVADHSAAIVKALCEALSEDKVLLQ